MNIQPSFQKELYRSKICQIKKSRNNLGIERIDHIKDNQRNRLVIFLESNLFQAREVYTFIKGNNLIIEASRSLDYAKPVRTHLIEEETLSDSEYDGLEIGFSEIQLNPGYRYSIISYQIINPGLLKVILNFRPGKNKMNHN